MSEGTAAGAAAAVAAAGGTAAAPAAGEKPAKVPFDKKQPPSLKATVCVLFVLFLIMSPDVRWRFGEFNLWVRSCIPYGGNPPYGVRPGGSAADVIVIEARFGANSELMSGRYTLLPDKLNGRHTWFKNAPGQEAYLLWDECSSWLISKYPTGNSPNCEGWAYTAKCYGLPWECAKLWMLREDGTWDQAGNSVGVTPFYGEDAIESPAPACSSEDEESLIKKFGDFDIVIPWINGSDPKWLADRARTCEDWQWKEMWSDAVTRSMTVGNCLRDPESIAESTRLVAKGKCIQGVHGKEGACVWAELKAPPIGITTRSSRCFQRFVDSHCTGRVNSIQDHDELRYLLRSVERHLPWHRGRILLISPGKIAPSWLKPGGRLEVLAQEDLLQEAVSSATFVNAEGRKRNSDWAPGQIFNDYPVQAAFAFVPKANRIMMLLQDDLLFARKASVCDYFTSDPPGLRLFGRPFEGVSNRDPFSQIYESMEHWTAHLFKDISAVKAANGKPSTYYRDLHLPHMLDRHILEDLWRDYPEVMSDAVSSSFRHPNLTNVIALHHSEAKRRSVAAAGGGVNFDNPDRAASQEVAHRVENLVMNISGSRAMHELPWMEVVFESKADWKEKMAKVPPNPEKLPGVVGLQDNLGADMQTEVAELDCMRERWLNKLLPGASSWEDEASKPQMCRLIGKDYQKAPPEAKPTKEAQSPPKVGKEGRDAEL